MEELAGDPAQASKKRIALDAIKAEPGQEFSTAPVELQQRIKTRGDSADGIDEEGLATGLLKGESRIFYCYCNTIVSFQCHR